MWLNNRETIAGIYNVNLTKKNRRTTTSERYKFPNFSGAYITVEVLNCLLLIKNSFLNYISHRNNSFEFFI